MNRKTNYQKLNSGIYEKEPAKVTNYNNYDLANQHIIMQNKKENYETDIPLCTKKNWQKLEYQGVT